MTIVSILVALLILGVMVAAHEFGHFFAARMVGIAVTEFSIGIGPKIFSKVSQKSGTKYSLRALPVGGYCMFYGDEVDAADETSTKIPYQRQPVWKRMFSLLMGPMMNFLTALVVAFFYFWIGGVPTATGIDPYIAQVMAAGPAYEAGLADGDVIEKVNGESVLDGTADTLMQRISAYQEGDEPLRLTVRRGQKTFETSVTPVKSPEDGSMKINVTIGGMYRVEKVPISVWEAAQYSGEVCLNASGLILKSLQELFTTKDGIDQVAGPVGMVKVMATSVQQDGLEAVINMLVVISINLGVMNLLPIPGLDGSRFWFMLLEAIRRKPVPPEKEAVVHLVGMVLLLGFALFLTFRDIQGLF